MPDPEPSPAKPAPRRSHVRDFVYGGIDGAVTTFAIVAGVIGAGLPDRAIVILGIANVLADGFSMAAGNYSGTKAEADDMRRLRAAEERQMREDPEAGRAALRQILALKGLDGDVLDAATREISSRRRAWIDIMLVDGHGLSPLDPQPLRAALATFGAFLLAGMVPLMPFLTGLGDPFAAAIWMTAAVFFGIGALKSRWSLAPWWRSGLETLAIGGAAAGIAFAVGRMFHA